MTAGSSGAIGLGGPESSGGGVVSPPTAGLASGSCLSAHSNVFYPSSSSAAVAVAQSPTSPRFPSLLGLSTTEVGNEAKTLQVIPDLS